MRLPELPITSHLNQIRTALDSHPILLLSAPPGTGKTTILPLALLNERWAQNKKIVVLEPRRIAARSVSMRMAELLGEPCGKTVGYRVRFDSCISAQSRIEVVTEGLFLRRLIDSVDLSDVAAVIFDEFHERSLSADISLSLVTEVQAALHPELRVIIMSATLDSSGFRKLLKNPVDVVVQAATHPLEIEYAGSLSIDNQASAIAQLIQRELSPSGKGPKHDILVFLPGRREIAEVKRILLQRSTVEVYELYGELPYEQQKIIIGENTTSSRRVILATPLAETSLTIAGVRTVIDSGLVKVPYFETSVGMDSLRTVRISQDSATQRAGRAARTGNGLCIRGWTPEENGRRPLLREPEAGRVDITQALLDLAAWGVKDFQTFPWITRPPTEQIIYAVHLLHSLGALRENKITEIGGEMRQLGVHPRLAKMILFAREYNSLSEACLVAALLEEQHRSPGVLLDHHLDSIKNGRDHRSAQIRFVAKKLENRISESKNRDAKDLRLGVLIGKAFPERIAKRRKDSPTQSARYLLAQGTGAVIKDRNILFSSDYLAIADLREQTRESVIELAATLNENDIDRFFSDDIEIKTETTWDDSLERVIARQEKTLGLLSLNSRSMPTQDNAESVQTILQMIRARGIGVLQFSDEVCLLKSRCIVAATFYQELELPDLREEQLLQDLESWLEPFLDGTMSLVRLRQINFIDVLSVYITYPRLLHLGNVAPSTIPLPSGRQKTLAWDIDSGNMVLRATVQELLGMSDTPRIGDGRIPLVLEILSPAKRVVQITRSLSEFWKNSYFEVRKELRGRYPKHRWPEDPTRLFDNT